MASSSWQQALLTICSKVDQNEGLCGGGSAVGSDAPAIIAVDLPAAVDDWEEWEEKLPSTFENLEVKSEQDTATWAERIATTMEPKSPKEVALEVAAEASEKVMSPSLHGNELQTIAVGEKAEAGCEAEAEYKSDWLCAICLADILPEDTALIRGCEHAYCVYCILEWASRRETPMCPQCKEPFTHLLTYRYLNGTYSDSILEESVCLLLRSVWFVQCSREKKNCVHDQNNQVIDYEDYEDYYEDDDEEDMYLSSRVLMGNRRFGENGYMRSGRLQARVVTPVGKAQAGGKKGGSSSSTAPSSSSSLASSCSSVGGKNGQKAQGSSSGHGGNAGGGGASGSGSGGQGRRARRNQKRRDADVLPGMV